MKSKSKSKSNPNQNKQAKIRRMRKDLQLPPYRNLKSASKAALVSEEKILNYLTMLESEPDSTLAKQLIEAGIELPPPQSLAAEQVHDKLWEVINGMAQGRHFISQGNHLSDLELYQKLWLEILNKKTRRMDDSMGQCACRWDLASCDGEESDVIFLQYYADEFDRSFWQSSFPEEKLPPRCEPLYDRDRNLPNS